MRNILSRSFRTFAFTFNSSAFRASLVALLALAGSFAIAGTAKAQIWNPYIVAPATTPFNFGNQMHSIHFLDKQGRPDTGFLADSTQIWYTYNGGVTWTLGAVAVLRLRIR